MKDLLDKIFPTLSDELIIVISLIIGLLVTASLILFLVKKIFPKTNISELAARTRSWWIMAGMFIGAVFISYNISYFFLAFLSFIAFRELYSVLGFREADRGALFWGILAIPIQYYLAYLAWYGAFIIFIPVVMFLVLPLRLVLKGDTHGITKSMALLQWILMLSVFGISHLAYLLLVKKIFPKTNISELAARTRSWWIMAGMFIGAVFISYNISYFFLAFLSFIAFRELYSVLGFREADRGALFWGILAIPIQYYLAYLAWYGAFIIFIPVVMFLVLPLSLIHI